MPFLKVKTPNSKLQIPNLCLGLGHWPLKRAFTLIEILVAVTILSILTSIATVSFNNALDKGRDTRRKQDLTSIKSALTLYFEDNGKYPPPCALPPCQAETYVSNTSGNWIPDLTPTYIKQLPKDPRQTALNIISRLASLLRLTAPQRAPPQVAGQSTFLASVPSGYSVSIRRGPDSIFPPTSCTNGSGTNFLPDTGRVQNNYYVADNKYDQTRAYLGFDTSSLDDAISPTSAILRLKLLTSPHFDNSSFNILAIRKDWSSPIQCADWQTTGTQVGSITGASLPSTGTFDIAIDPASINKTGLTKFELKASSENLQPSGLNAVEFDAATTSPDRAQLIVTWPDASPTPSPSPSASPVSSPSPTPTPTPLPSATPALLSACPNQPVYCYVVPTDRKSYTLWVRLENTSDPEINNCPDAPTGFNYCLKPD